MRTRRQDIGGLGNLMFKQAYLLGKLCDGEIPDVYVQGEKYWRPHAETIKKYFSEGIGYVDKVSIHIRRGDYLKADNFHLNLWNTDYYDIAVKLFPNDKFLVFCKDNQDSEQDKVDRQWCMDNLPSLVGDRFELSPLQSETDDLNLMASCKSNIMANSSFSWWAAYLNINPQKTVVCPRKWFVDGIDRTELLDSWLKI